ncbi:cyclase family protein [Antrihabitans sp. YC2-6]|uniref:cyclase family protein n=1 Tax=Antrihabitans sp. YC2-6 TaxID=2799498 RepID=UPI0018F40FED|nr:cyclase family protein [Antrihabitans sp. YC2-6]MBJ8348429.1 cyclase family protein [Antrihabitans sp. YC2-6]
MKPGQVFDLTHTLHTGFPLWPGDAPFEMTEVASVADDGFEMNELRYWEHVGTHVDAPSHRAADGLSTDLIPAADLVAPLVVIDISGRAADDADTVLTVGDIADWERANGCVPNRAFVAMNSGWDVRLGTPGAFVNLDSEGIAHAPGFSAEAVRFLVRERDIVGLGVDTLSIDCSSSREFGAHSALLSAGRYCVEALANLSAVPAIGALVVVGAPTHRGGSGGPCRVLAIVDADLG